ncbi:MAG: hypothetical protein GPW18_05470 [Euryarchaeota archaeon]|nr:hypothetical protein [Euryarchaeota archaeon]
MVVVIPSDSKSNVVISYNYPASVGNISPCITYDNSYNFPLRWSTNLNVPKTQAYTNITSVWSSGIYSDDNGNVFWTDTYGNVFSSTFIISIYSYVNSSSISTYSLPEAEAFTVGSSTVNVNFVTLYLEMPRNGGNSGSIVFSIGTSLWKADVLANTTVNVFSGKLWYNITIPTISLTGGTTYYLNVYQVSGNVYWGYTSSPSSSSKNYVQDYWYQGSKLYHDNSSPNIYTIGYRGIIAKSLGTPYSNFAYAGPITSIAAVNYSLASYVIVLTYYGYVFGYNLNNKTWFNATHQWNLPLTNYPAPWTSVTSNTKGYPNYDEGFYFTDLSGNVYLYDTSNTANSKWLINNNPNINIVSTAVSYDKNLYAITYNGNVYYLTSSGWVLYDSTGISHVVGITIDNSKYLYLLPLDNGTKLYKSSTTAGTTTGTFTPYGNIVFSKGTNEAVTYDRNYGKFWAIQTNGTIANDGGTGALNWYYTNNYLNIYRYPAILAINSACSMNFDTYALYLRSKNITSMLNFTLYFTGSDSKLNLEFYYDGPTGHYGNPQTLALLTSSRGVLINVTMMPNMAYNSTFYFYSVFYPANNQNSVILEYILTINVVNHFSYINC